MEDRGFTFFLEDQLGERASFEIEFYPDEAAAEAHARHLLEKRPRYRAVEVFDGQNSTRVERPSA